MGCSTSTPPAADPEPPPVVEPQQGRPHEPTAPRRGESSDPLTESFLKSISLIQAGLRGHQDRKMTEAKMMALERAEDRQAERKRPFSGKATSHRNLMVQHQLEVEALQDQRLLDNISVARGTSGEVDATTRNDAPACHQRYGSSANAFQHSGSGSRSSSLGARC